MTMKTRLLAALLFVLCCFPVAAQIVGSLPFTLTNGTIADANQVMANFNTIVAGVNSNAATAGVNSNITSIIGLTTPLSYPQGGSSLYIGGTGSNSGNNYTVASPTPTGFTLTIGKIISFTVPATNTGAAQLNVNGTGLTNFFRQTSSGPVAMLGGEMVINSVVLAFYDGTQYECLNCVQTSLVPSCTTMDYSGVVIPSGFLLANGSAQSRTTFAGLFNCLAYTSVSATTNSNTTVNITGAATFIQVGWYIGGNNVTCNSFVTAVATNSITISAAAGATGATTLTIGPYQQGDCSTTFNLPNYTGKVIASVDGSTNITSTQQTLGVAGFTNGSAVITLVNNFVVGQSVQFTTTNTLPTNFATGTTYYVIATGLSTSQFEVSATPGGSAISAGSAGTGTQSATAPICSNSASLGDKTLAPNLGCGGQATVMNTAFLPPYTPAGTFSATSAQMYINAGAPSLTTGSSCCSLATVTGTFTGIAQGGTSTPFNNLSPTSLVYKIIKT
jgi:hypothetical protein